MFIPQLALACGSLLWGQRRASLRSVEVGGCRCQVLAIRNVPTEEVKAKPFSPSLGGPVGALSHLPNKAVQDWLLTPDLSYPHAFVCTMPLTKNTVLSVPQGSAISREPSLTTLGTELLHCRPSGLSPPLIFTRMCASCGCILITQPDPVFPEGTYSLPSSTPPLSHTQHWTMHPTCPQR